ncbi:hypothetical protein A54_82 [Septuagintavirus sv54]|uniref:Uncharacterized protein n=1 Tax=Escherichia phage A5-4 TaxID=2996162 RepID=A0AAE9PXV4_9CAUD|nr:hypothetical protein A54_82 [Escherichia phage A5-4]
MLYEVFAGFCFYGAAAVRQCDDYVVESFDDPLACEIVTTTYEQDRRWINPACIASPEVEAMPEGEELTEEDLQEVKEVMSYMIDNLDAENLQRALQK